MSSRSHPWSKSEHQSQNVKLSNGSTNWAKSTQTRGLTWVFQPGPLPLPHGANGEVDQLRKTPSLVGACSGGEASKASESVAEGFGCVLMGLGPSPKKHNQSSLCWGVFAESSRCRATIGGSSERGIGRARRTRQRCRRLDQSSDRGRFWGFRCKKKGDAARRCLIAYPRQ